MENGHLVDIDSYYRKGSFTNFTQGAKCSFSITSKIDVTDLYLWSKKNNTKFYINFMYALSKALNSSDDYKMEYRWQTNELFCYDKVNPCHYVFFDEQKICSPVYSEYFEDYKKFYNGVVVDSEKVKARATYINEGGSHPNWFEASYISWENYKSLNIELPDGYLYFMPIINWGRFAKELIVDKEAKINSLSPKTTVRLMMPITVRMNHAIADGYTVAKLFELIRNECDLLIKTN